MTVIITSIFGSNIDCDYHFGDSVSFDSDKSTSEPLRSVPFQGFYPRITRVTQECMVC